MFRMVQHGKRGKKKGKKARSKTQKSQSCEKQTYLSPSGTIKLKK